MFGYYNRILTVNLTDRSFAIEAVEDETIAQCFGGKGLATHLLLERNRTGVDPLSPDNHLIFATGAFCGGRLWGGSRYGVYTKSPLTGLYAESYSGGKVPEAIDSAGFDAIILVGKADRPTVLTITPEGAFFHDAGDLWGTDSISAEEQAVARFAPNSEGYRKPGAVTIGRAGENLVKFALIANDKWRCAGRTGGGAVMGSKQVKAIVFQGDRKRKYFDADGVAQYAKDFASRNSDHPGVKTYKKLGTTVMVSLMNTAGAFPAKYWQQGSCDHFEKISGERYHADHEIKPHACAKCFMACGRMAKIKKGRHQGLKIEGPEYETIYSFGGLCMVEDMAEIAYLNDLCDRLGMDTITAGNLCGLAIEASNRGKIDFTVEYGNVDQIAALIKMIAAREGIGAVLADGIITASRTWGLEDIAIHVKGMEPAGYDPRALKGMGLTFGTSPRGACHLRTTFYKPELSGIIPPEQTENKAEMLIEYEDRLNIFDTLVLCRFYRDLYTWEELETAIHAVTGQPASRDDLEKIARNIVDMTRTFNLREGLQRQDDLLPERFHNEPLPSGKSLTSDEMEYMLADYYRLRGWDETGTPAKDTIAG
ncbi:aldehyde ferredoxin oxidoreductase family protein [Desulforhopalus singaporensis]|uniref:Aldehyde:ferredoxin oxidoreductase n=1 Tax=Desulforhopalus singaporensis TaxID=91360 RepID=A0A1H0TDI7_9BACT|nr:aldehyde ferredoxin oxidoreductase family protein [Desulforhopalus singaporensis]SDP51688.1 aldehyde:ferredoxin oxidoreductase [Desulforhopalus singaporensis]